MERVEYGGCDVVFEDYPHDELAKIATDQAKRIAELKSNLLEARGQARHWQDVAASRRKRDESDEAKVKELEATINSRNARIAVLDEGMARLSEKQVETESALCGRISELEADVELCHERGERELVRANKLVVEHAGLSIWKQEHEDAVRVLKGAGLAVPVPEAIEKLVAENKELKAALFKTDLPPDAYPSERG